MILPVADVYKFMQAVADLREEEGYSLHQPIVAPFIYEENGVKKCDLNAIPMWQATACDMKVDKDTQDMHFIDAVNWTLHVLLCKNDRTTHEVLREVKVKGREREREKIAEEERKLLTLEQKAKKWHRATSFVGEPSC